MTEQPHSIPPNVYNEYSLSPFLLYQHNAQGRLFRLQNIDCEEGDIPMLIPQKQVLAVTHLRFEDLAIGELEDIEAHYFEKAISHPWQHYDVTNAQMSMVNLININKTMDRVAAESGRGNGWVIMVHPDDVDWLTSEQPSEHTRWIKSYKFRIMDWSLEATNTQYSCHIWSSYRVKRGVMYSAYRARHGLVDGIVIAPAEDGLFYYDPNFPDEKHPYIVKVSLPERS